MTKKKSKKKFTEKPKLTFVVTPKWLANVQELLDDYFQKKDEIINQNQSYKKP
jgi:hypothetical protein